MNNRRYIEDLDYSSDTNLFRRTPYVDEGISTNLSCNVSEFATQTSRSFQIEQNKCGNGSDQLNVNNLFSTKPVNQDWLTLTINYFMLLLSTVSPNYTGQKILAFHSSLFDSYLKRDNSNIFKTLENIFDYYKILIPIFYLQHWSLAVIDLNLNEITHYDFDENSQERLEIVKSFLKDLIANYPEWQSKYKYPNIDLRFMNSNNSAHQQADASGYFTCAYAKRVCLNFTTNFSEYNINDLKNEIFNEIRNDSISGLKILKHHLNDNLISIKSRVLNLIQAKSQISNKMDIEQEKKDKIKEIIKSHIKADEFKVGNYNNNSSSIHDVITQSQANYKEVHSKLALQLFERFYGEEEVRGKLLKQRWINGAFREGIDQTKLLLIKDLVRNFVANDLDEKEWREKWKYCVDQLKRKMQSINKQ